MRYLFFHISVVARTAEGLIPRDFCRAVLTGMCSKFLKCFLLLFLPFCILVGVRTWDGISIFSACEHNTKKAPERFAKVSNKTKHVKSIFFYYISCESTQSRGFYLEKLIQYPHDCSRNFGRHSTSIARGFEKSSGSRQSGAWNVGRDHTARA